MNQLTRNLSYTGTGIVTEPAVPAKTGLFFKYNFKGSYLKKKSIPVVRTATLTRRSSFPVSLTMGQHILNSNIFITNPKRILIYLHYNFS